MNEELQFIIDSALENMSSAIEHLESELLKIRAGKANPVMLSSVLVDYYGSPTPLSQVANVSTPDARTLSIQPWEKALLSEIEKAIMNANLGFNPMNNGESIIINVPPLTEERRKELAKMAKAETETAKVSIRNARKTQTTKSKNQRFLMTSKKIVKLMFKNTPMLTSKKLMRSTFAKKKRF